MAPSAMRSRVESKNAPNLDVLPVARAIAPSIRSLKMKQVITRTPMSSSPRGKNTRAPAETPRVPTSVTASGLMPSLMKALTIGASMTLCQKCLNLSNMTRVRLPPPSGTHPSQGVRSSARSHSGSQ